MLHEPSHVRPVSLVEVGTSRGIGSAPFLCFSNFFVGTTTDHYGTWELLTHLLSPDPHLQVGPPPPQLHFGPFIPICIRGGEGQASLIRGHPCLLIGFQASVSLAHQQVSIWRMLLQVASDWYFHVITALPLVCMDVSSVVTWVHRSTQVVHWTNYTVPVSVHHEELRELNNCVVLSIPFVC